jgi:hypothetical protein
VSYEIQGQEGNKQEGGRQAEKGGGEGAWQAHSSWNGAVQLGRQESGARAALRAGRGAGWGGGPGAVVWAIHAQGDVGGHGTDLRHEGVGDECTGAQKWGRHRAWPRKNHTAGGALPLRPDIRHAEQQCRRQGNEADKTRHRARGGQGYREGYRDRTGGEAG